MMSSDRCQIFNVIYLHCITLLQLERCEAKDVGTMIEHLSMIKACQRGKAKMGLCVPSHLCLASGSSCLFYLCRSAKSTVLLRYFRCLSCFMGELGNIKPFKNISASTKISHARVSHKNILCSCGDITRNM